MRRQGLIVTGAGIGLLLGGGLTLVLFFAPVAESLAATQFERSLWQAGSQIERGRMARDLESSGRLLGLGREQIIDLLGPPDDQTGASMSYKVDIGHRFGSDPWFYLLRIEFNESGEAESVSLHD